MQNRIQSILCELGISTPESIVPYFPRVRDREDVAVLRCNRSGVLFLSRSDHIDFSHYEAKSNFGFWGAANRDKANLLTREDAERRYHQFKSLVTARKWVDIGTGCGGILDLLSPLASETAAVEPQENQRKCLQELGYRVYASTEEIPDNDFDIGTLFHVFEHLTDPVQLLRTIHAKLKPGGYLVIEVPHARDLLLSLFELDSFKAFTFWSEHLILHTRESLSTFLKAGGYSDVVIQGFQRYPLANHLHWLAKGLPKGHLTWPHLRTEAIDASYAALLAQLDQTDTLIALARK